MIKRPIHMSHDFLAEVLDDESIVVDATMGNGNDTAFLALGKALRSQRGKKKKMHFTLYSLQRL